MQFGQKECLTILGRNLFATPGPLTFFLTTVVGTSLKRSKSVGELPVPNAYTDSFVGAKPSLSLWGGGGVVRQRF